MSAGFKNLPVEARSADGLNWTLTKPLVYETRAGLTFQAVVGATTDGPSIPRRLWSLHDPFGPAWPCGVLHDAGYRDTVEMLCRDGQWRHVSLTREMCDDIFKESLQVNGAGAFDAEAFYLAVKNFGEHAFKEDREEAMKTEFFNDHQGATESNPAV